MTAARFMPEQKPGKSVQEVGTPRAFLDAVEARFGKLAWDLAADETNHVTAGWSGPGSTKQPDSLAGAWWALPSGLLWLNPPYANIGQWTEKCAGWQFGGYGNSISQRIALLIPAAVGTNYFRRYIDGRARVYFLSPRLTFVGHTQSYPKDLILAMYGETTGYECWRWRP